MRGRLARIVLTMLVFGLAACGGASGGSAGASCAGSFKASTDLGVGEGLKLLGNLSFQIDTSGGLSGTFSSAGQPNIQVVGQVSGRAVNLTADLGGGTYLFGTGTVQSAANGCPTIAGGPLSVESPPGAGQTEHTGTWFYQAK